MLTIDKIRSACVVNILNYLRIKFLVLQSFFLKSFKIQLIAAHCKKNLNIFTDIYVEENE